MGGLLRELRESQGLSQRELAKRLDRTQAFVWKVEQGIQHLDIPTLIDLAQCLDTRASHLIGLVEGTPRGLNEQNLRHGQRGAGKY